MSGLNGETLDRGTGVSLPEGWDLIALETVESTNAVGRALVEAGQGRDGTVIWAREQQGGRGRQGRVWHSPPGNLYHSYVLRGCLPLSVAAGMSFVAAVSVADALERVAPHTDPRCKWPNDIVCHGGKVCGMLLETVNAPGDPVPWLVLGIGINVATAPVTGALFPALALADLGQQVEVEALLSATAERLALWVGRWRAEGLGPVRARWLERALGLGKTIEVRVGRADRLKGLFEGLDEDGTLILRTEDGALRRLAAGDVFFPSAQGGA
ncbi:biotin--[acetyl-CoA-carboxylase] ligase [Pararhodospirillum oryzae]|uniref:biotin--[biotin carboxyl-carrier protein] ligase n=1 Tax=Pararhodospirillum oryzae TaxID=478448 RepID=A0A512H9T7_9PROT|nr:biotin--[acetyl-CoA-carboxylase] ligase [Pararhodospirillum oryzae]GEO82150.1 biotin--[acetyl-CoA-carboxylase] ligase [Pararhodospirillum oryzae]